MLDHRWDLTPTEAIALRNELRARLVLEPPPGFAPRTVGGADVSMSRGSDRAWAGFVVLDAATLDVVETSVAEAPLEFPHVPGLLSFRELPPLALAWTRLARRPDAVIFDGAGYAHPRRFGFACHGGVLFDVPSVGCAKTRLVGTHPPVPDEAGAMDVDGAVRLVLSVARGYREPETTRAAHRVVNEARKAGENARSLR